MNNPRIFHHQAESWCLPTGRLRAAEQAEPLDLFAGAEAAAVLLAVGREPAGGLFQRVGVGAFGHEPDQAAVELGKVLQPGGDLPAVIGRTDHEFGVGSRTRTAAGGRLRGRRGFVRAASANRRTLEATRPASRLGRAWSCSAWG